MRIVLLYIILLAFIAYNSDALNDEPSLCDTLQANVVSTLNTWNTAKENLPKHRWATGTTSQPAFNYHLAVLRYEEACE